MATVGRPSPAGGPWRALNEIAYQVTRLTPEGRAGSLLVGGNLTGQHGSLVFMGPEFDDVVRSRYEPLRRAAYVLTGDVNAADDLVQNALVKAMRHWGKVRQANDLDAYLYTVLMRTHRSSLRRRWRDETPTAVLPDDPEQPSTAVLDRVQLKAALVQLTPAHREVLVLRFMADWSEAECAAVLGCSVGTIKSRTSRALAAVRGTHLIPEGDRT